MYCKHCGAALPDNICLCTGCGTPKGNTPDSRSVLKGRGIGYSERIHDPAFARYLKHTNRWSALFSMIMAIAAVIGFYIYGETSLEMENPQAMFIGLGIGGMFLLIALYSVIARKTSKTWDGMVVDKTVKQKNRRHDTGNNDSTIHYYTEYAVIVRDERGKTHRMTAEDDMTVFDYFQVGDHVRHHAGLNSYEKYDKSRDSIIFCNACGTLCDIMADVCFRCNCPLLK